MQSQYIEFIESSLLLKQTKTQNICFKILFDDEKTISETGIVCSLPNGHKYVYFKNGDWAYLVYAAISTRFYFQTGTYYSQSMIYSIHMNHNDNNNNDNEIHLSRNDWLTKPLKMYM
jgi:hypothetical protein